MTAKTASQVHSETHAYLIQGTYIEFKDTEVPDAWLDSLPKGAPTELGEGMPMALYSIHVKVPVCTHPSISLTLYCGSFVREFLQWSRNWRPVSCCRSLGRGCSCEHAIRCVPKTNIISKHPIIGNDLESLNGTKF